MNLHQHIKSLRSIFINAVIQNLCYEIYAIYARHEERGSINSHQIRFTSYYLILLSSLVILEFTFLSFA